MWLPESLKGMEGPLHDKIANLLSLLAPEQSDAWSAPQDLA